MKIKGDKIRALREERGLTLIQFAAKAKVSTSYLSELERGTKQPSLKTLEKIALALNVPREAIVDITLESDGISFGDKLQLARKKSNLSVNDLAGLVQLSVGYLSEIEKGKIVPAVATINRLAKALEVPVASLLTENSALGMKLRNVRDEMGYTQASLANQAGVSAGLVAQIEQGKVQPSFKTVEKLAAVLGVSPCYFVLDNDNVESMLPAFSPQLLELLQQSNVQAVLRSICHLNEQELQFVLNFIQLFKKSSPFA